MWSKNQASQRDIRFYEIKLDSIKPNKCGWVIRLHCSDNSTSLDKISEKYHITSIVLKSSDLFDIYTLVA